MEIGKDIWLKLIQDLLPVIDSRNYSLTAKEVQAKLDSDPNGLFDLIRDKVNFGPSWLTGFTSEIEHEIAQLFRGGDVYGEAVHKLELRDGLTPIIASVAIIWAKYR